MADVEVPEREGVPKLWLYGPLDGGWQRTFRYFSSTSVCGHSWRVATTDPTRAARATASVRRWTWSLPKMCPIVPFHRVQGEEQPLAIS